MHKQLSYGIILSLVAALAVLPQTRSDARSTVNPEFYQVSMAHDARYILTGKASWYSKNSPGIRKHTANNEVFDDRAMTCAMWGAPFNQRLRVTNLDNGKSVEVRVNDRGPHPRFLQQGRIIDLTEAAFSQIAPTRQGLIPIRIEYL
ncbi:MAG: septal ring lytic transglycosylase RlpA family lipoprotein [Candidatus Omnitrophica bacterium]|nr:septal ring lytic transglycosylase RlpA family lipoprotein [Candidatus Omnitrophota bacterium]